MIIADQKLLISKLFFMRAQILNIALLLTSTSILFSCQKEIDKPAQQEEFLATANSYNKIKRVWVGNVDQLYTEINNPENAGSTLVLSPGIYMLNANHPHGGRLELLHDMSLTGQPGQPGAVIIDVSNLPFPSSFTVPATPTSSAFQSGAIRMGDGSNGLEWLTIQNEPIHRIRSLVQTDIIATSTTQIKIAHCILKGSSIGMNIINNTAANGRIIETEIEDNEIFDNKFSFGAAIQIQNSNGVQGASIKASLRRNYLHGNSFGVVAFNGQAPIGNNQITIASTANRIENNGLGIGLQGGLSGSSNSSILFKAYGDVIRDNLNMPTTSSFPHIISGGVYIAGGSGRAIDIPGITNNNRVEAHFHDCIIKENIGTFQINAFGGRTTYPSSAAVGIYNTAKVYLYGISTNATVNAENSFPVEPEGTNTVNIYR